MLSRLWNPFMKSISLSLKKCIWTHKSLIWVSQLGVHGKILGSPYLCLWKFLCKCLCTYTVNVYFVIQIYFLTPASWIFLKITEQGNNTCIKFILFHVKCQPSQKRRGWQQGLHVFLNWIGWHWIFFPIMNFNKPGSWSSWQLSELFSSQKITSPKTDVYRIASYK